VGRWSIVGARVSRGLQGHGKVWIVEQRSGKLVLPADRVSDREALSKSSCATTDRGSLQCVFDSFLPCQVGVRPALIRAVGIRIELSIHPLLVALLDDIRGDPPSYRLFKTREERFSAREPLSSDCVDQLICSSEVLAVRRNGRWYPEAGCTRAEELPGCLGWRRWGCFAVTQQSPGKRSNSQVRSGGKFSKNVGTLVNDGHGDVARALQHPE